RGMRFGFDFGTPREIDSLTLDCARDQHGLMLELEGQDPDGYWKPLATRVTRSENAPSPDLRATAVREIAARGITHVLMRDSDFGAHDFRDRSADWGLRLLADQEGWQLYAVK